jgi:hypothetical protein
MKVSILHTTKFEGETQEQLLRAANGRIKPFVPSGMEVIVYADLRFNDEEMAAACLADVIYCIGNPSSIASDRAMPEAEDHSAIGDRACTPSIMTPRRSTAIRP